MRDEFAVLRAWLRLQLAIGVCLCACSGSDDGSPPRLPAAPATADADAGRRPEIAVPPEKSWPLDSDADAGAGASEDSSDSGVERDGADAGAEPAGELAAPADCDVTAPTGCSDPPLRYADVAPIFADRCTGCHNGSDGRWPLTTYQHVADWYAEIRGQMLSCTMPPLDSGMTMTIAERERILLWIRCGFPR